MSAVLSCKEMLQPAEDDLKLSKHLFFSTIGQGKGSISFASHSACAACIYEKSNSSTRRHTAFRDSSQRDFFIYCHGAQPLTSDSISSQLFDVANIVPVATTYLPSLPVIFCIFGHAIAKRLLSLLGSDPSRKQRPSPSNGHTINRQ